MGAEKRKSLSRRLLIGLCIAAVIWLIGCSVIYSEMRRPPEQFGHFMAKVPGPVAFLLFPFETMWTRARVGTLKLGDPAPDFTLLKLHESQRVQLSALIRQQPVVLVFGSYT